MSLVDRPTKAIGPNKNSNLVTAAESSLTAWIRVVTINWSVQVKLLFQVLALCIKLEITIVFTNSNNLNSTFMPHENFKYSQNIFWFRSKEGEFRGILTINNYCTSTWCTKLISSVIRCFHLKLCHLRETNEISESIHLVVFYFFQKCFTHVRHIFLQI